MFYRLVFGAGSFYDADESVGEFGGGGGVFGGFGGVFADWEWWWEWEWAVRYGIRCEWSYVDEMIGNDDSWRIRAKVSRLEKGY